MQENPKKYESSPQPTKWVPLIKLKIKIQTTRYTQKSSNNKKHAAYISSSHVTPKPYLHKWDTENSDSSKISPAQTPVFL